MLAGGCRSNAHQRLCCCFYSCLCCHAWSDITKQPDNSCLCTCKRSVGDSIFCANSFSMCARNCSCTVPGDIVQ
jgi:hypothetical protein